jgi:hypothetical protein
MIEKKVIRSIFLCPDQKVRISEEVIFQLHRMVYDVIVVSKKVHLKIDKAWLN